MGGYQIVAILLTTASIGPEQLRALPSTVQANHANR